MIKRLLIFTILFVVVYMISQAESRSNDLTLKQATLQIDRVKTPGNWVPAIDGTSYYQMENGTKINKIDYRTGKMLETVFDANTARSCTVKHFDGFEMSDDETKILLYTNKQYIYRRSFEAEYYTIEIKRNLLKPLTDKGAVRAAKFSHDARMVAFVYENNIYLKKLDFDSEVQVTTDGKSGEIINGVSDWVYEEEFYMTSSITFSPDDAVLSYLKWNEKNVGQYSLPIYEGVCPSFREYAQYPGEFSYKYPVAGTENSTVNVYSYDVDTRKTKQMQLPESTYYIPDIRFSNSADRLMVMTLNRDQNDLRIFAINPRSTVSKQVYHETSDSWIDINAFTANIKYYENSFVVLSSKSGYAHLYKYNNSGNLIYQVTKGEWNVTDFYGYNATSDTYYYQSTEEGPLNRTVSKIKYNAKGVGVATKLSKSAGWNDASFNTNYAFALMSYSSIKTPNQYTLYNGEKKLRDIELNESYAKIYTSQDIPQKEFFTCDVDGNKLNGYMIKPSNFDSNRKYPLIMCQYSGPGSQSVKNSWSLSWEQYMANEGFIIACVDGRGTGARDRAFETCVYMNLGHYESIDQVGAAKYLASLPYVDSSKIGIYGWSYGGYETLMAMSQKNSAFAAGVAIAPVTDWRFYDTIYAERYMRTPQQNEVGYDSSSAIKAIPDLKGRVLIISGTLDDNVHIANTLQYTAELTNQNKICDMMIYTNKNHSIYGCDTRYALYLKVIDFFKSQLK
ncbi:MAG: S9 family peptidase [Muribaculaceae bacterium]|nr:S9 family peptidase [Muribaculaceae bacterium]